VAIAKAVDSSLADDYVVYEKDHWQIVTKLDNEAAVEAFVSEAIDNGKIALVRYTKPYCYNCELYSMRWNEAIREFGNNKRLMFGDFLMEPGNTVYKIKGELAILGLEGFPCFRYYNQTTGYQGDEYSKFAGANKDFHLMEWIEDTFDMRFCPYEDPDSCPKKMADWLKKYKAKDEKAQKEERDFVEKMMRMHNTNEKKKLQPDQLDMMKRKRLLLKHMEGKMKRWSEL